MSEGESPEQAGDGQYDLSGIEALDFEVPERLRAEARLVSEQFPAEKTARIRACLDQARESVREDHDRKEGCTCC